MIRDTDKSGWFPTTMHWASFLSMLAAFVVSVTMLVLLYHCGDRNGDARTTFGKYSAILDRLILGLQRGERTFMFAGLGAAFGLLVNLSIFGGIFAGRQKKTAASMLAVRGGCLVVIATIVVYFMI